VIVFAFIDLVPIVLNPSRIARAPRDVCSGPERPTSSTR
jgi:hypothetical protein